MKKFIAIFLSVLVFSNVCLIANASDAKELSDYDEFVLEGEITRVDDYEIEITLVKETVPSISAISHTLRNGGSVEKTTEVSKCLIVTENKEETKELQTAINNARASGTQNDSYEGGHAILYSTISYSTVSKNGLTYMYLTSANGRVTLLSNATQIIKNQVKLSQTGIPMSGSRLVQVETYNLPSSFNWSVTPPSDFVPVRADGFGDYTFVGCVFNCTVRRGTADTTYTLDNNYGVL